ncbi:MAG: hypothetical protein JSV04_08525, partial [Candidatus Heimdallarchaeota archaeon]
MSEVQKELVKAKANEDEGNFDKAAKQYFNAAKITNDIKLFNKAFFTARKSGNSALMFQFGKQYYDVLEQNEQHDKINELIPTFLEISGRERTRLTDQAPEALLEVLNWTITLYNLVGNTDAAYEISHQTGDTYFGFGQQFLSTSHLLGKEEKWKRGLDLLDNAIEAYQQIRLDTQSLEKIIDVKLDKISKLIDIGRHAESIESTSSLMNYFDEKPADIIPFSKEDLSFRIANTFAEKTLSVARAKRFDISNVLMKTAKGGFENAGKPESIAPFLWQLALIYDEHKQKELFFSLVDETFEIALRNEDNTTQESVLNYLTMQAREISGNILSSRMIRVKKGPIEFQNNEGVQYLLKSMELAKKIDDVEIPDNNLVFLFQYAKDMYEKKIRNRSLPYLEFCAQTWWKLPERADRTHEIINFLEEKVNLCLTEGKFETAATHLGTIISIKIFIEDSESAGNSAFSFAQAAGQQGKQSIELEFLERAYDAFVSIKATPKLQEMLTYITHQMEPLFNLDSRSQVPRDKFIQLGDVTSAAISEQSQGEFLKYTSFKALNAGLLDLGMDTVEKTFEVMKNYDNSQAADLLFQVGSTLLETHMEKAVEFISKSTTFAVEFEPLKDVVDRNLNYLQERALTSTNLPTKVFLANKLELLTEMIGKIDTFNEFLFIFTQNLAETLEDPNYFAEAKNYLSKAFYGFHIKDPNHPKLQEIITWTNTHILEKYSDTQHDQMYELAVQSLDFHEKTNQLQEYITFFWDLFNKFTETEDFPHAIALFKQTNQTLERVDHLKELQQELTKNVVSSIDRGIKPKIADEKFDEAWPFIKGLFSILKDAGLHAQAIDLYKANAAHFAPHRIDLAIEMWNQSVSTAKQTNDRESIASIVDSIINETLPVYSEQGMHQTVSQLYSQAIECYQAIDDTAATLDIILKATRHSLSLGDFQTLLEWGGKGFQTASESKNEASLFEFANMYFAVGSSLLADNPEVGVDLIKSASDYLREYGPSGFDHYFSKMAEIYETMYNSPLTQQVAQKERDKILQHFRETGKQKEEGNFLVTTAKLSLQAGNVDEAVDLLSQATAILRELEDEDGLSEIVSVCLKGAARHKIGTKEYEALSRHAASIQETGIEISEEKTQEAFGDLFDGMLDDMTSLFDPKV